MKRKHSFVIEVSFDRPISETDAWRHLSLNLDHFDQNRYAHKASVIKVETPKRLSRVLIADRKAA